MRDAKKGIEGLVPSDKCWVACERVFEKAKAYRFEAGLCERVSVPDAKHKENV